MDYTTEDELLIKEKWEELLLSCTKICKNDEDWNLIKRAFFLAKEAHQGVRRRSGEPYLLHPIAVARIVIAETGRGVSERRCTTWSRTPNTPWKIWSGYSARRSRRWSTG